MIASKITLVQPDQKILMYVEGGYSLKPAPCKGFLISASGTTVFLPYDLLFPDLKPAQKKVLDTLFPTP